MKAVKITKIFLASGIAIILAAFVIYGLSVVYKEPLPSPPSLETCQQTYQKCLDQINLHQDQATAKETCELGKKLCLKDAKRKTTPHQHARNTFYLLFSFALLSITLGIFFSKFEGIGSGFIGGGVLIILWNIIFSYDYWLSINEYIRLAALGITLLLLIFLGYRRIEKGKK